MHPGDLRPLRGTRRSPSSGLPVKDVGERLAFDSGTLTPLLKRLEHQGLVERRRGEDERVVRIHLTAAGRALRGKARKMPMDLACRAGYDLASERSVRDLVRLRDELTALTRRLSATSDEGPAGR